MNLPSDRMPGRRGERAAAAAAVVLAASLSLAACSAGQTPAGGGSAVPSWAADQIWYQIFPERFRNGDPANDPTRESLPNADRMPASWAVTPWGADWYERAAWETELNPDFYRSVRQRRYGGDLQGVIDRLPYLETLGITGIYFNPIFQARSEHKYDGNLFHHIDPYFGPDPDGDFARIAGEDFESGNWAWTAADSLFLVLVKEAHARGMRVIIDGVFNHVGRDFPAFVDLREKGQASKYADWFKVLRWDDPATPENEFDWEGWWGGKSLPEFADTADSLDLAPGPKAYVFAATARWLDPNVDGDPSDGVDGWRLDVVPDVPVKFWTDWNDHVRRINPDAYTVAEIWQDATAVVAEGRFSASMNYHGFAFPVKGFLVDGRMAASEFRKALDERRMAYPRDVAYAMQNLIDSHDTERVASMIVQASRRLPYQREDSLVWFDYDWGRHATPSQDPDYQLRPPTADERAVQRLVALFQMTWVGAPMVYYGTETGMWGADDPDDRGPMLWEDIEYADRAADPLGRPTIPAPLVFDAELHEYYRSVIALRRSHASLRTGEAEFLYADETTQTVAFARTLEDERLVVVLNRSRNPVAWSPDPKALELGTGEGLYPIFSTQGGPGDPPEADAAGTITISLRPLEGRVFIRTGVE